MKRLKIGVVILNYNTWRETAECVDSIRKYTTLQYHIYIVDNLSNDDSVDKLEIMYKTAIDITFIKNKNNNGYSAGNNVGVKRAVKDNCEFIFIINSDVELLNDALTIMTNTLLLNKDFMIIGPTVLNNEGQNSQLLRSKVTLKSFIFSRQPFLGFQVFEKFANRSYVPNADIFAFNGCVSGCCFGIRTIDFVNIDYFDENIFLYGEESVLSYKMEARGKLAVYDSNAKVWHKEGVSTKKEGNAFVQFHRWNSGLYILRQYARISYVTSVLIALWNTLYWSLLSIKSKNHRKLLGQFWKKNWGIALSGR